MLQIYCHPRAKISSLPLVVGAFNDEAIKVDSHLDSDIDNLRKKGYLSTDLGTVNKIYTFGKIPNEIIYVIGLGKRSEYNRKNIITGCQKITFELGEELLIDLPSLSGNISEKEAVGIIVETLVYNNYRFDQYLKEKSEKELKVGIIADEDLSALIKEALIIGVAVNNTRDLVNQPYNHMTAEDLAGYAQELVANLNNSDLSIEVYEKEEIERMGMNAFLAVNQGSTAGPKLLHIKYQPVSGPFVGLIGKGLMYDTGGYSLKSSMNTMKSDMAGAATVLGVLETVVKNALPINIQVIICATDNRINGHALLPDDIITAMNGKTIEILSTDAEGRLTLADALCFAQKYKCKKLIDIATLTGAVVVALGEDVTGLFGNDEKEIQAMIAASQESLEELWPMPINDAIRKKVRSSKVADLKNSTGRNMGASSAAAFLEEFVEEGIKWLHLDIAGTAYHDAGATGAVLRTIYRYLKSPY
ncbi:MAG: leucyl aminopeptidase [Bacilli bacterium]|nr:leucyl aminopeptidase [Bacilli bacterium]